MPSTPAGTAPLCGRGQPYAEITSCTSGLFKDRQACSVERVPRRILASLLWFAVLGWCGGTLWLSSLSPENLPRAASLTPDKFNHFAAFAVGGWLVASALRISRPSAPVVRLFLLAIALVAAFAAFDELLQLYTPGRTGADLYDWIADFLGAIAGTLFSLFTHAFLVRLVPRP
jgi:VanZ family protein